MQETIATKDKEILFNLIEGFKKAINLNNLEVADEFRLCFNHFYEELME